MKDVKVAYDYDSQKWISGEQARILRMGQVMSELELLRSSKGEEYAQFLGVDLADTIRMAETELAGLIASA